MIFLMLDIVLDYSKCFDKTKMKFILVNDKKIGMVFYDVLDDHTYDKIYHDLKSRGIGTQDLRLLSDKQFYANYRLYERRD